MSMSPIGCAGIMLACVLASAGAVARERTALPDGAARPPVLLAENGGRMSREEHRRLRDDLESTRREMRRDYGADQQYSPGPEGRSGQRVPPPAGGAERRADSERQERRLEAERLREEVRAGRLTRPEAFRQYRERFGEPGPHPHAPPDDARQAEIERLRDAVRNGQLRPEEARERIREQRMQRAIEASRLSPDERERLRRDIMDTNRDMQRR